MSLETTSYCTDQLITVKVLVWPNMAFTVCKVLCPIDSRLVHLSRGIEFNQSKPLSFFGSYHQTTSYVLKAPYEFRSKNHRKNHRTPRTKLLQILYRPVVSSVRFNFSLRSAHEHLAKVCMNPHFCSLFHSPRDACNSDTGGR